jgi:hypothetical protein
MRKFLFLLLTGVSFVSILSTSAFAGIHITSPGSGSSVQSPVHFVASSTTNCAKGIYAMGVYDNGVLMETTDGDNMDTSVALTDGTHNNIVVQNWDKCGGYMKVALSLKVGSTTTAPDNPPSNSKTFAAVENFPNWHGFGELAPKYEICTSCTSVTWGFKQNVTAPPNGPSSTATRYDLGGSVKYSDALFSNHTIGDGTTQNMPDKDGSIMNSIRHMVYDVYFYGDHLNLAHALEFDIGLNVSGRAMMFGTECRMEGNKLWAVWDNPTQRWVDTKVPCKAAVGKWNHLVIKFSTTSDHMVIYDSITLNGTTTDVGMSNKSIASNWHGMVINFQLDGNGAQNDFSVYLDKLNITYY